MDSLCRVCTKSPAVCRSLSSKIEDSSDLTFLDFFNTCTSLNAREGDSLPQKLCLICANSMETFYAFVKVAQKSDAALKEAWKIITAQGRCKCGGETPCEEIIISNVKIEKDSEDFNQSDSFHCQPSENLTEPIPYTLDIVKEEPQLSESTPTVDLKDAEINEGGKFESSLDHPKRSIDAPGTVLSRRDSGLVSVDTEHIDFEDDIPMNLLKKSLDKNGDKADAKRTPSEKTTKRNKALEVSSNGCENFSTKCDLKHHREYHRANSHKCDQCGKTFKNGDSLKYHIIWHAHQKLFKCDNCGRVLSSKCQFDRHVVRCTRQKKIKCQICGKILGSKQYLNGHMDSHKGITHECDRCYKIFENIYTLRQHIKTHDKRKPFRCEHCGKCYAVKSVCCGFLIKADDVT